MVGVLVAPFVAPQYRGLSCLGHLTASAKLSTLACKIFNTIRFATEEGAPIGSACCTDDCSVLWVAFHHRRRLDATFTRGILAGDCAVGSGIDRARGKSDVPLAQDLLIGYRNGRSCMGIRETGRFVRKSVNPVVSTFCCF